MDRQQKRMSFLQQYLVGQDLTTFLMEGFPKWEGTVVLKLGMRSHTPLQHLELDPHLILRQSFSQGRVIMFGLTWVGGEDFWYSAINEAKVRTSELSSSSIPVPHLCHQLKRFLQVGHSLKNALGLI